MAHPLKREINGVTGNNAKLRRMTRHYGAANEKMMQNAPVNKMKQEGPEDAVEFGADSAAPNARADRPSRRSMSANPLSTYKKGGAVKGRASGGRVKSGKTNIHINVIPQGGTPMPAAGMPPVLPMGGNPAVPPPAPPQAGGIPPALAAALAGGAGGPPGAMRPPGMMPPGLMRKRGGRVHSDEAEDASLIHKMVKSAALKRAKGGKIHMTAGSESGPGRLEKTAARRRNAKHEHPQAV